MGAVRLRSSYINHTWEAVQYRLNEEERKGLEDLLRFYSPFGVLRKVLSYFGAGGSSPIYVGHGQYYDFDYVLRKLTGLTGLQTNISKTLFAGGKGASPCGMFVSSIAEMVERILGALDYFAKADTLVYGSYRRLSEQGYPCLGPKDLPLFAPEQFNDPDLLFEPFTEDSEVSWIEGKRLISGKTVWMPAQLVTLFYTPRPDEAKIGYSTTGGLASHISECEALFHGITELFERDAVNLRWYCRIAPERIEFDRPPHRVELRRLLAVARELPSTLTFYHHSLDFPEIPVITVIAIDDWLTRYAYYSGGGVGLDIDAALLSALTEYGQAERNMHLALAVPDWGFAQGVERMFSTAPDEDVRMINIFFKIVAYYGYKPNIKKMHWYLNGGHSVPLSSLPSLKLESSEEHWERLLELLARYAIDPIVFDFTPPQMERVRLMKTYIPELTPPFLPSLPLLGHPRYYEVPQRLGLADRRLTFADLNTDPLPYP